jgi:hypothetical protein
VNDAFRGEGFVLVNCVASVGESFISDILVEVKLILSSDAGRGGDAR